jgi:formiminotetrahydrofolate cyclodeaminase
MTTTVAEFLDQRLTELLDDIASETPAPGGGAVAGVVVAMAAGLVAMAARFSEKHWEDAADVVERAEALRRRCAPLAPADAQAYEEVLTAFRLPKDLEPEVRNAAIGHALARAAEIPLEIAKEASEVAVLGALVAAHGNPNLRGDAIAGAVLAEAGARVAANLVEINLGTTQRDERIARAREHVAAASAAVERAFAVGP